MIYNAELAHILTLHLLGSLSNFMILAIAKGCLYWRAPPRAWSHFQYKILNWRICFGVSQCTSVLFLFCFPLIVKWHTPDLNLRTYDVTLHLIIKGLLREELVSFELMLIDKFMYKSCYINTTKESLIDSLKN